MKDLFLSNHCQLKFIDQLKEELKKCKRFYFSVSFIKIAGFKLIEKEFVDALERGTEGKLITTTYQNFTDIPSLKEFLEFSNKYPNFQVHLDYECFGESGFHSKGYLFETDNGISVFIGSTNITRFALLKNVEWNIMLSDQKKVETYNQAKEEFDKLWDETLPLSSELIDKYRRNQEYALVKWDMDYDFDESGNIKPNSMQKRALKELMRNRDLGVDKSLVIAATGSGKTYLAAFDAKNFDAKRLLFVVHRDVILNDAIKTFSNVFKARRSYGLYNGKTQDLNADFIFASSAMLSKHLEEFDPQEFDYIVYDEAHHIVAECGSKIINYFEPSFLLGLTATPERLDNQDIFSLFGNNVSFEMRLRDALNNNLVVPFHYYAIRDEFADYSSENKSIVASEIAKEENVSFIAKEIDKHKIKGQKLKAIAFCTSLQHAQSMKEKLEEAGYNTVFLSGSNDTGARIKAFQNLQDETNPLEIICCVDILNEGVDIPLINMVLFLRPTESPTIFLQQLGRGLRKAPNKNYCVVLDFIGNNYRRSTQIAFALGTLTKSPFVDPYTLKTMVKTNYESLGIPGLEIFFDELSKQEIISYLDNTNFYKKELLEQDYLNFKKYLKSHTYPTHLDYLNGEIAPDLIKFIKSKTNGKKNRSYYQFLQSIGEDTIPLFNDEEIEFLNEVSDFLPLVRKDEYLIIKQLLEKDLDFDSLIDDTSKINKETLTHAYKLLEKRKIILDGKLNLASINDEFKSFLLDTLNYGISRYDIDFGNYSGKFKLMANYYKEQIMMILLENGLSYMKGTKFNEETKETYIFVNLKKDISAQEKLNYKDKFIDQGCFQWESENNVTLDNSIGKKIQNTKIVHLFVRKMEDDHGVNLPYTYFGTGHFENMRISKNEDKPTLLLDVILDKDVEEAYYDDFDIKERDIKEA